MYNFDITPSSGWVHHNTVAIMEATKNFKDWLKDQEGPFRVHEDSTWYFIILKWQLFQYNVEEDLLSPASTIPDTLNGFLVQKKALFNAFPQFETKIVEEEETKEKLSLEQARDWLKRMNSIDRMLFWKTRVENELKRNEISKEIFDILVKEFDL